MRPGCVFCKIIAKEIPSELLYDTPEIIGFKDVKPQAPVHVLLVPRRHISDVQRAGLDAPGCVEGLVAAANQDFTHITKDFNQTVQLPEFLK